MRFHEPNGTGKTSEWQSVYFIFTERIHDIERDKNITPKLVYEKSMGYGSKDFALVCRTSINSVYSCNISM